MRTLFAASTALALVLAMPASAEMSDFSYTETGEEIQASGFIGARVYTSEMDVKDNDAWSNWDGDQKDWDDVGEIHDILMTKDGQIAAILVDVGGFLGIGEKQVAVSMDNLRLQSDGDDAEDYFVVFNSSREALENAPEYEMDDTAEGMPSLMPTGTEADMTKEAKADTAATDDTWTAPNIAIEGWTQASDDLMSSDKIVGARVYDANDTWIGEVDKLIVASNGKIEEAVIDVGGFLGIGEKPVAVQASALNVQHQDGGTDFRVYVDATKERLMDMPEYEG